MAGQMQETPEKPIQPEVVSEAQPSKGYLKIVLLVVLGLIILAGAIYAGMIIGKKQASSVIPGQIVSVPTPTQTRALNPTTIPTVDPTASWKTYKNEKYGFEIKYPKDMIVKTFSLQGNQELETSPSIILLPDNSVSETEQPHLVIQATLKSISKSQSLINIATQDYENSLTDYFTGKENNITKIIDKPKQATFQGKNAVTYSIYTDIISSPFGLGAVKTDTYKMIWVDYSDYYYFIYTTDNSLYNQILSTFKFLD